MKITLKEKNINYGIILKQRMRKEDIDIDEIRRKSCSKNYFTKNVELERKMSLKKQENIILKDLMDINQIVIKPKLDEYYQSSKDVDIKNKRSKVKNDFKKQMNKSTVDEELLEAIKDVD